MYNNTQRNRAGALEELNKFFLGKDEQIALSDLPPLRSPQAMPRGYKDGENVTADTVVNNAPDNFWSLLGRLIQMGGWALLLIVIVPMLFSWLLPGPIQFKGKKGK